MPRKVWALGVWEQYAYKSEPDSREKPKRLFDALSCWSFVTIPLQEDMFLGSMHFSGCTDGV